MATFVVGAYQGDQPIKNAPAEVESALASKAGRPLTKQDVAELLLDCNATSLCLTGYTCDEAAVSALCECVSQSLNLSDLSLRGMKPDAAFNTATVCVDSLVENLSIQRVDVGDCALTQEDVGRIAESVIPWNRTVIDWDFSGNASLGDAGVNAIVDALIAATTSVQRLNLQGTGITDVAAICKKLEQLTCLYQVDVSGGAGSPLTKDQATSLHQVLMNNAGLLRPSVERKLVPLVEGAGDGSESKKEEPAPVTKEEPAKKEDSKPASPTQRQRSSSKASRPRSSSRAAAPPPKKEEPKAATAKEEDSPPPKKQQEPAASPQAKKEDPAAQKQDETKPAEKKQQPAPASQQRQRTSSPAPARSSSQQSTQRGRSAARTGSPARGRSPAQRDVNDGVEEWKAKRNEYNNYIRAASPAAASRSDSPSRRGPPAKPRFVLGKRVDDNPRPNAAFTANPGKARERPPTPSEIRKYAPWNQKNPEASPAVGGVTKVVVEEGSGLKPATVVTFVDGGKQTYLEEDPRDMAYQARKIQSGAQRATGSLYRSNTARELRFGTSFHDKGYVQPRAQAPGPGFYQVESEWEKRARMLRERGRAVAASGKPLFGSAAPRPTGPQGKDMSRPGPGEYEIP